MVPAGSPTVMVRAADALPGRATPIPSPERHYVLGTSLHPPFPAGTEQALLALGCFWGAEQVFWTVPGVVTTAAGYSGGFTPNPTYEEVASGRTGHAESVLVVFDPARVSYDALLQRFWEHHDPTQGFRQGPDVGTQYRSAIFPEGDAQRAAARSSRDRYAERLAAAGHDGPITTEIAPRGPFYYAEDHHQQYLARNPGATCFAVGTGVSCPIGGR